jgi:guanosine-3',5'-bis(diphosphate) 3'-pyrophosphohydrolase
MPNQIQTLIKRSRDPKFIEEVFEFAKATYQGKTWLFGHDDYINHATRMASTLGNMGLDEATIAAALLYGVADTSLFIAPKAAVNEIEKRFGQDIARLVSRAAELNKIYYSFHIPQQSNAQFSPEKNEDIRKMFFAIAKDLRVILIKIASRIDGLNQLEHLPQEKRALYANETLHIFVPIANRLGLGEIKTQLEDLAFKYLYPEKFAWMQEHITKKYEVRQKYLKKIIPHIKKVFEHEKLGVLDINYRAKSYWSTYQKLLTHDMDFEKIHDLVALRIIVSNIANCYKALGIIHKYYQPISNKINDYIAKPKPNGYQSLHTDVFLDKNNISEIQIRTENMDQDAQYGVCAHWLYKEKAIPRNRSETVAWTKEIPSFWKTFTIDFFENQVFTFTPKGDVIVLPKGATPIDFAYAVHSDIGNHCESAKIDGKIIPLNQALNNGDIVEIIINKKRSPSQDWLRFVKTNFAKSHIKKIITAIPLSLFSVPSFVKKKITEISGKARGIPPEKIKAEKEKPRHIYLAGQKGMLVNIAKCCNPEAGDMVKAYISKHRAAVLHKTSCKFLQDISKKFPEKIIDASWK